MATPVNKRVSAQDVSRLYTIARIRYELGEGKPWPGGRDDELTLQVIEAIKDKTYKAAAKLLVEDKKKGKGKGKAAKLADDMWNLCNEA
jgi:hypothetical protein